MCLTFLPRLKPWVSCLDYDELSYPNEMDKLVKMGLVKNYTGSRMANLYCMKDEKGIEDLMTKLYELDEKDA